jgi:alanyl-tRNA synthetase
MQKFTHTELRNRFLSFYADNNHMILPSGSLVLPDDKSTLFTTAGVQPLIPYLKFVKPAPAKRIANAQKCLRTNDIEEVGDDSHLTFFEMLGSWSIGDYGKPEAIKFAYDFVTSERGLNLPKERIWVTVFAGSNNSPRDEEAARIWQNIGLPKERIAYLTEEDNWWSTGPEGVCGPDTEIFFDLQYPALVPAGQHPGNDPEKRFVEIWNTVFMIYDRKDGVLHDLPTKNIDEGAGLERLLSVVNQDNIYRTSCFDTVVAAIEAAVTTEAEDKTKRVRIVADHLRTCLFVLSEEPQIFPSATAHGYVLRRLIRSATQNGMALGLPPRTYVENLERYSRMYADHYPEVEANLERKLGIFQDEQEKFQKLLQRSESVWNKLTKNIDGLEIPAHIIFRMVTEQGIPLDIAADLSKTHGTTFDSGEVRTLLSAHQKISQKFPLPKPQL